MIDLFGIDFNAVADFLTTYGLVMVVLVALLIAIVYVAVRVGYHLEELRKVESKYFDHDTIDLIDKVIKISIAGSIVLLMTLIGAASIPWVHDNIWAPMLKYLPSVFSIALIVLVAMVLVKIQRRLIQYLLASYKGDATKDVRARTLSITGLVLKYIIYGIAAVLCMLVLMTQIPQVGDSVSSGILDFIAENGNILGFIVLLVIVAYFANKFAQTVVADYAKGSGSKLRPDLANLAGKAIGWGIYAFAAVLILFSMLTLANLGEIGQTMLILGTTFVGLIFAFAATGSIGNILSGVVLMAFKPFEDGDRVKFKDGLICDVVEQGILFTKVRTLQNELVDIPNNDITGGPIINFSQSGRYAISITLSIGYDVKFETVKALLTKAAEGTPGIVKDPAPTVFATNLANFYIEYELFAYTETAKVMKMTRSDLIAKVQEAFDSGGVEILSPSWNIIRRDEAWKYEWPPKENTG
ncbi:MAG: mechanosensitive ion channel domain-containing protein [Methanobacteriota archaeon]